MQIRGRCNGDKRRVPVILPFLDIAPIVTPPKRQQRMASEFTSTLACMDCTVTTWRGSCNGREIWRVRNAGRLGYL